MLLPPDQLTHTKYVPFKNGQVFCFEQPHALFDQLSAAVSRGDADEVRSILPQILPLPDDPPQKVLTALAEVLDGTVQNQRYEMLAAMLAADATLVGYQTSCYAVEVASIKEDFRALQMFLDAGWNVNESGPRMRRRPLIRFHFDQPQVRTWLLEHGADPNGQNCWSITNLEAAAVHPEASITQALIDYGGNAAQDDSLIVAARWGHTAVAELLLKHGADVNKPEKDGAKPGEPQRRKKTALHEALIPAMTQGPQLVDLLLTHGANVDATDADGNTLLASARMIAEDEGDDSLLKKLEAWQATTR